MSFLPLAIASRISLIPQLRILAEPRPRFVYQMSSELFEKIYAECSHAINAFVRVMLCTYFTRP